MRRLGWWFPFLRGLESVFTVLPHDSDSPGKVISGCLVKEALTDCSTSHSGGPALYF